MNLNQHSLFIKISLILILGHFTLIGQCQDRKPIEGLSVSLGAGVLPFGTNSIGIRSQRHGIENGHVTSTLVGISYVSEERKIGGFIDASLMEQFRSTAWLPFTIQHSGDSLGGLTDFYTQSNSLNLGFLLGGAVAEDVEIFGKFGFGVSWHDHQVSYNSISVNNFKGQTTSSNYQVALEMRYMLYKHIGFSGSLGISDNFPIGGLRLIGSF